MHPSAAVMRDGSSPLSRGIRPTWPRPRFSLRIIPALAGNTGSVVKSRLVSGDHPRSRGEYSYRIAQQLLPGGSSPLSRGIRFGHQLGAFRPRIIPALAGNTSRCSMEIPRRRDHPRSRGEYAVGGRLVDVGDGSSPLSRGIRRGGRRRPPGRGIIPALAGNTRTATEVFRRSLDRPRSRGEYQARIRAPAPLRGSPPLSRGILRDHDDKVVQIGIIPALAGNTFFLFGTTTVWRDHPRSRGEYVDQVAADIVADGSSPLSRGIPSGSWFRGGWAGIIPALAGNTPATSRPCLAGWDHPRSRGEYPGAVNRCLVR